MIQGIRTVEALLAGLDQVEKTNVELALALQAERERAGLTVSLPPTVSALICGEAIGEYDATRPSSGGRCPHCGVSGQLEPGYGLAAGGVGSYNICDACLRVCDSVQDLDEKESSGKT